MDELNAYELLAQLSADLAEPDYGPPVGYYIDFSSFLMADWDESKTVSVMDPENLLPSAEWFEVPNNFSYSGALLSADKTSTLSIGQTQKVNLSGDEVTTSTRFSAKSSTASVSLVYNVTSTKGFDAFERDSQVGKAFGDIEKVSITIDYKNMGDPATKSDDSSYLFSVSETNFEGTESSDGIATVRGTGNFRLSDPYYQLNVQGGWNDVDNIRTNTNFRENNFTNYQFTNKLDGISFNSSNTKIRRDFLSDSTRIELKNAVAQTPNYKLEAAAVAQTFPQTSDFVPNVLRESVPLSETDYFVSTEPFLLRGSNKLTVLNRDGFSVDAGDNADIVNGGIGPDTLIGGAGRDSLNGGAGDDVYVLGTVSFGPDTVTDTGGANDVIAWYEGRYGFNGIDMYRAKNNLIIRDSSGGQSTVVNQFGAGRIETFRVYVGNDAEDIVEFSLANSSIATSVVGSELNDWVAGTAQNDTLVGGFGNDVLQGDNGNDSLTGGDGDDFFVGGLGNDSLGSGTALPLVAGEFNTLEVEPGNDTFVFWDHPLGLGKDTINAGTGYDVLEWRGGFDPASTLPPSYQNGGAVIYRTPPSSAGGATFNDYVFKGVKTSPGSVSRAANNPSLGSVLEAFRYIDQKYQFIDEIPLNMSASGTDAREMIMGFVPFTAPSTGWDLQVKDTLMAFGGDDVIFPGAGTDSVNAGDGNDVIFSDDDYSIAAGDGTGITFLRGFEKDSIEGGDGDDFYAINGSLSTTNSASLDWDQVTETSLGGLDTIRATFVGRGSSSYTLPADVENLILGPGLRGGTGNDSKNEITGNSLNNTLDGGAGDDTLGGGDGNDSMLGGDGNDNLFGDAGNDTLAGGAGNNTLGGGDGNDSMLGGVGNDNLFGDAGNDTLAGGDGDDFLDGGNGDDLMLGGDGNDTYVVDRIDELKRIVERSDENTYDTVIFSGFLKSESEPVEIPLGIEKFIWSSDQSIRLTGNESDNSLYGNRFDDYINGLEGEDDITGGDGNDTLDGDDGDDFLGGGDGNDSLLGGDGNDNLFGDTGDDYLLGGGGNDGLNGGQGSDTLEGGMGDDYYNADLNDKIIESPYQGNDTLNLIELNGSKFLLNLSEDGWLGFENINLTGTQDFNVTGNALDNRLNGNAGDNILEGGSGNDRFSSGGGDDVFDGGKGNDGFELFRYFDDTRQYAQASSIEIVDPTGWDDIFASFYWSGDDLLEPDSSNSLMMNYMRGLRASRDGSDLLLSSALNSQETTIVNQFADSALTVIESFGTSSKLFHSGGDETKYTAYQFVTDEELNSGTSNSAPPRGWTGQFLVGLEVSEEGEKLIGGDFSDIIQGGNVKETIWGGGGQDFLYGGEGDDEFIIDLEDTTIQSESVIDFDRAIPDLKELLIGAGVANPYAIAGADAVFDFLQLPNSTGGQQDLISIDVDTTNLGFLGNNDSFRRDNSWAGVVKFSPTNLSIDPDVINPEFNIYFVNSNKVTDARAIYFDYLSENYNDAALIVFSDNYWGEWDVRLI